MSQTPEKNREKPYRVHQDFTIVRDNLRQKLAGGVFPEDHPPVVNLIRAVDDRAANIRRAILRVRETVAANAPIRLAVATPEEREKLMAALAVLESISREGFAQDVAADREEIAEPIGEATGRCSLSKREPVGEGSPDDRRGYCESDCRFRGRCHVG